MLIKKYSSSRQDDLSDSSQHLIAGGGYQFQEDVEESKNLRNDPMTEKLLKMSGFKTCDQICQEFDFLHVSTSSQMCKNKQAKLQTCTLLSNYIDKF